jgi:asparagine synthetase B (glutamine-hydrolysing)
MAHGVESRAPFMDPNLVERLMSYKTEDRVGNGYTKYIFRKEMEKIVPKEIIWDKHKIGFQSPTEKYRKDLINYLRKHKSGLCAKDPAKMSTPELIKLASFTMWKELFLK